MNRFFKSLGLTTVSMKGTGVVGFTEMCLKNVGCFQPMPGVDRNLLIGFQFSC